MLKASEVVQFTSCILCSNGLTLCLQLLSAVFVALFLLPTKLAKPPDLVMEGNGRMGLIHRAMGLGIRTARSR